MASLWDNLFDGEKADHVTPRERRRRLGQLHRSLGWDTAGRKGLYLPGWGIAAAAALLIGLFAGGIWAGRRSAPVREERLCLVAPQQQLSDFFLPDGSHVWLNAGSRLYYDGNGTSWNERTVTLEGEAFFDVTRDEAHPFTVQAGDARVRVLGTRFNVRNSPVFGEYQVALSSGRVEVSLEGRPENYTLSPGELCELSKNTGKSIIRKVEAANYSSWTGERIVFDNRPLADVAVNLEHRYNVRIHIAPNVNTSERISFTLKDDSMEEALRVVERLARVRCRAGEGEIVIEHK